MSESERLVDSNEGAEVSERELYFKALRLWIQQAHMYQSLSTCFPYYMMTMQGLQTNTPNAPLLNNNYQLFRGPAFLPDAARPADNQAPAEPQSPAESIQFILLS